MVLVAGCLRGSFERVKVCYQDGEAEFGKMCGGVVSLKHPKLTK